MSHNVNPVKQTFHNIRRNIARTWLSIQPALQIAITGSQGKTNTANIISTITSQKGSTISTHINLDTVYNVPITTLKVMPWTKYAVFELGVDKIGEMDFHLKIVRPKIAVITGISPVHTDEEHLKNLENLIREKQKLINTLPCDGYAILNYDDKNIREMANNTKAKILWYGNNKEKCDVWSSDINVSINGTQAVLNTKTESFPISTPLLGKHFISNIMAGYLVSKIIGLEKNTFVSAIKSIVPIKGRMSIEKGPLNTLIINDSLRANPSSTKYGLKTLSEIDYKKGKKIAVLAEMGELQHPEEEHRKIGQLIPSLNIDFLVLIGPLQKYTAQSALEKGMDKKKVFAVKDVFEAYEILKSIICDNDLIYLKGSLLRHIERVLLLLKGKDIKCRKVFCDNYHQCVKCKNL